MKKKSIAKYIGVHVKYHRNYRAVFERDKSVMVDFYAYRIARRQQCGSRVFVLKSRNLGQRNKKIIYYVLISQKRYIF